MKRMVLQNKVSFIYITFVRYLLFIYPFVFGVKINYNNNDLNFRK